jgi:hypothetical protein
VGTPAQNEANRNNSLLSTGPKTSNGKRNSARNSYKNGLRANRDTLLREESVDYEMRMHRWSDPTTAENDRAEFMLQDNVAMSFEIERTRRSHFERLRRLIENEDTLDQERVHELGCRLFHDRTGPTATYGTRKWDQKKARASWEPEAARPDRPAELVRRLCSSALGCFWLLEQWDSLKERLCSGPGFWVPPEKFKAVRLLRREPIDMLEDRRVADVFAAAHALYRVGKPFDNLISDMSQGALDTFEARVNKLYRDLVRPNEPKRARQILIDLVDENIREIEGILAEHVENRQDKARRDKDYNGFDPSREGEAIRRHWLRCRNSMDRGMKTYEKLGKRRSKAGRGSDSGSGLSGMGDGKADGTRSVPATGNGREDCGRIGSSNLLTSRRDASFAGPNSTMVEVHASDIVACAGFLPERVAPRALAAEKMEIATELVYPAPTPPGPPLTSGGENGAGLRVGGVTEDDGTADGPGEGFIAGGGSDVASAVLVSRSPGDCPLTPALSRRERESEPEADKKFRQKLSDFRKSGVCCFVRSQGRRTRLE